MRKLTSDEFDYLSSYFASKKLKNIHVYFKPGSKEPQIVCNVSELSEVTYLYYIYDKMVNELQDRDVSIFIEDSYNYKKHVFVKYKNELIYYILNTSAYEGKNYLFLDVKRTPFI